MTVQELVEYCNSNNIPLDTQLAIRAKDDYFVSSDGHSVYTDSVYFGNCREGEDWMSNNAPRDVDNYIDYGAVKFLILDTGRG